MGKATATFIHSCDVHIARGEVAGNLDVADEWYAARDLPSVSPSDSIISGITDEERTTADIEVVLRDVHPAIKWGGWVVICPARFAVVL